MVRPGSVTWWSTKYRALVLENGAAICVPGRDDPPVMRAVEVVMGTLPMGTMGLASGSRFLGAYWSCMCVLFSSQGSPRNSGTVDEGPGRAPSSDISGASGSGGRRKSLSVVEV